MSTYSVAIVGTGPDPETSDHEGYSMGYRHARGFEDVDGCRIDACADIVAEHAETFADTFDVDPDRTYTDHARMLDDAGPDIVSICTPPTTHRELVEDCARHDAVRAIHCEKPLAVTFGDSRRIVEVCDEEDVQLSVNLQNRYSPGAAAVKERIEAGAIGELERIELARHDLLQTGIHHIDLANYVVDEAGVEWVLGQIHYPEEELWYTDMHSERQGLGMWKYDTGVHGLCSTGEGMAAVGRATNQFIGTDGRIRGFGEFEIRTTDAPAWRDIEADGPSGQVRILQDVVDALDQGTAPSASGTVGLAATEIVFAIWESARRRARISLPLDIDDNPLESMVDDGQLPSR